MFESGILKTSEYTYEGTFDMMIPSGYGTATYKDGQTYIGHWEKGEWNGIGKLMSNGDEISFGIFKNGSLTNPQPFTIGEKVYGIDVSKWQRLVNWQELYLPADENGTVTQDGGQYM